ncbi:MAG TPA: isoprenylcysteine carboxylmethyltransferase family protein [Candidatus Paceibacterota bacterium]
MNKKLTTHHVLAHSYSVFLLGLLIGLFLDLFLAIKIIPQYMQYFGLILMLAAPLLIYWAQRTSGRLRLKKETLMVSDFKKGPYAITRGPTHLGLALLTIGFGLLNNAIFVVLFSIIVYFLSKRIFLKEQEKLLSQNYGEEYTKYQHEVNPWF